MQVLFDRSFSRALGKIKNPKILEDIENAILECEKASSITKIKSLKKLTGFKSYYRIKIGDYRIGIEFEKPNILRFITVLHRKDIYKKFPWQFKGWKYTLYNAPLIKGCRKFLLKKRNKRVTEVFTPCPSVQNSVALRG